MCLWYMYVCVVHEHRHKCMHYLIIGCGEDHVLLKSKMQCHSRCTEVIVIYV